MSTQRRGRRAGPGPLPGRVRVDDRRLGRPPGRAASEVVALCANGLHRFAPSVQERTGVAALGIARATARTVAVAGVSRVGLLGVRATMEGTFYREAIEREGEGGTAGAPRRQDASGEAVARGRDA